MAPMTEAPHHNSAESVSHFYDALAEDYDAMTDLSERFHRERPAFQLLVDRYGIRSAADAGTGTGFHALLLAELGVDITAVDISARMADRLRAHARDRALPVRVVVGDIRELHQHTPGTLDAVFCLGNTLAHMEDTQALDDALRSFALTLRGGGHLVIQLLNYDRILAQRETIQNVRQIDGVIFVRFYVFEEGRVVFNVLRLWTEAGALRHHLEKVALHPIGQTMLSGAIERAGFRDIESYGSIALDDFHRRESKDLVIVARLPL